MRKNQKERRAQEFAETNISRKCFGNTLLNSG
jgi:hypothetical protein